MSWNEIGNEELGRGWGPPRGRGGRRFREERIEGERIVDTGIDADGDEAEEVEVLVGVYEVEADETGAPRRERKVSEKVRRIRRKRQKEYDQWLRKDDRFRDQLTKLGDRPTKLGRPDPQAARAEAQINQLKREVIQRPLATGTTVAAGAAGVLTLTPQYEGFLGRLQMMAGAALDPVTVTSLQVGVDNVFSNPESSNGFSAGAFVPNNNIMDLFAKRRVTPQTPIKIGVLNGHTSGQFISCILTTEIPAIAAMTGGGI